MSRVRRRMDTWAFWVGIAYFGLALVVLSLFFVNQKTSRNIRRTAADEAAHTAEIVANARTRYTSCISSIPELAKINRFIHGVQDLHRAQEDAAKAILDNTGPADPLYRIRVKNYWRFKHAADAVAGVNFRVPTRETCRQLRDRLLNQQQ
jgi:hypothetical protein